MYNRYLCVNVYGIKKLKFYVKIFNICRLFNPVQNVGYTSKLQNHIGKNSPVIIKYQNLTSVVKSVNPYTTRKLHKNIRSTYEPLQVSLVKGPIFVTPRDPVSYTLGVS